jgi:hypothetical protein
VIRLAGDASHWLVIGAVVAITTRASAQELGWRGLVEGSGNIFFGATRQRLVAAQTEIGRTDSLLEVRLGGRLAYADGANDDNRRSVTARARAVSLALDYRPFDRYSAFWFGGAESSLQQRIASRYTGGVGAKRTFYRRDGEDVSLSFAVLGERARSIGTDLLAANVVSSGRWSVRGRIQRTLGPLIRLRHVTFYQPRIDDISRFLVQTVTSIEIRLTEMLALTTTLQDNYDTDAPSRGARSAHDGQMLFGLKATF